MPSSLHVLGSPGLTSTDPHPQVRLQTQDSRLVVSRAIAKRVTILVHSDFVKLATRLQALQNKASAIFLFWPGNRNVQSCLLLLLLSRGPHCPAIHGQHLATATTRNTKSTTHIRSSCEEKSDAVFCGLCESTNHVAFNCSRKASARLSSPSST